MVENNQTKNKRKIRGALVLGILAICLIAGSMFSFFSDVVTGDGEVVSGTLDIEGTYVITVNGEEASGLSIDNFNPGDVIVIKATVTNSGNKSAWIRDVITIDVDPALTSFIEIFEGEVTVAEMSTAEKITLDENGTYSTTPAIINGTGTGAEEETNGITEFVAVYTIYFSDTATNEAQGKSINFTAVTQALQYRNNTDTPTDTDWESVVTSSFGN
jgi:hypothetical protein